MLALKYIRRNDAAVRQAIAAKGVALDLDALLALDAEVRSARQRLEDLRAEKRRLSSGYKDLSADDRAELVRRSRALGPQIAALETQLAADQAALDALLLRVPNIPWAEAPVGPDQ